MQFQCSLDWLRLKTVIVIVSCWKCHCVDLSAAEVTHPMITSRPVFTLTLTPVASAAQNCQMLHWLSWWWVVIAIHSVCLYFDTCTQSHWWMWHCPTAVLMIMYNVLINSLDIILIHYAVCWNSCSISPTFAWKYFIYIHRMLSKLQHWKLAVLSLCSVTVASSHLRCYTQWHIVMSYEMRTEPRNVVLH